MYILIEIYVIEQLKPWRILLVNDAANDPELVQTCQVINYCCINFFFFFFK